MSDEIASNLTDISSSIENLELQSNVAINSNVRKIEQKVDKLETEELPAVKKALIISLIVIPETVIQILLLAKPYES